MSTTRLVRQPPDVRLGVSVRALERLQFVVRWGLVIWVIAFWRLGYLSLLDPDEAHYAELTREMVHAHSWLVPLLDGRPYLDKPILFHWMQGLSVLLLGESEFALRLPNALAAIALFATTRWLGVVLLGAEVGEWSGLMLATTPATFALASRGYMDMVFTAFLFGSVACLLTAALRARPRLQYVAYALLALAVMIKGPFAIALIALLLGAGWTVSSESRSAVRALNLRAGLIGVAIACAPWFMWMYYQFGDQFVQQYLLAGNLWYFTRPNLPTTPYNPAFYLQMFITAFFPWSVVTAGYAVDTIRRWRRGGAPPIEERLIWSWLLTILVFFTMARFRIDRYIFPAAPAACLLAARAWTGAFDPVQRRNFTATRIAIETLSLSLIVIGIVLSATMFQLDLGLSRGAVVLPAALIVGGAVMAGMFFRAQSVPLTVPVVMLLVVYATVVLVGYPVFERVRPTAQVARMLRSELRAEDEVGLYRLERWRGSLRYYLTRPVARLDDRKMLEEFLGRPSRNYVAMIRQDYNTLRAAGMDIQIVHTQPAVVGTTGRGLRRQKWDALVIVSR